MGHALGLWHEHQRRDRDRYVTILEDKIESGKEHNFDINYSGAIDIGRFDFNSVMLYHSWSFPKVEGDITMTKKDGSTFYGGDMLSAGDIYALKIMYEPNLSPMYAKLVTEFVPEESYCNYGGNWDVWYEVYDNRIEFYSDSQRTRRIESTDAIRRVEVQYSDGYFSSTGEPLYSRRTIFIVPGTWEYDLGRTVIDGEMTNGNTSYRSYYSYFSAAVVDNL